MTLPDKNPAADHWGGPGAGRENAKQPRPDPMVEDRDDPDRYSRHEADFQAGDAEKRKP